MLRCGLRPVDVDGRRKLRRLRLTTLEALGMLFPRIKKHEASGIAPLVGATVMNVAGRQERDTTVAVLLVVPVNKCAAKVASLLHVCEVPGKRRRILERFELRCKGCRSIRAAESGFS